MKNHSKRIGNRTWWVCLAGVSLFLIGIAMTFGGAAADSIALRNGLGKVLLGLEPAVSTIDRAVSSRTKADLQTTGGQDNTQTESTTILRPVVKDPSGPQTISNAGAFTNTAGNGYLQSNVNGLNPFAEYALQQAGNYSTFGLIGAVAVPAGPTGGNGFPGGIGVAGFSSSPCNSANRTLCGAVGGYFSGRVTGDDAAAWGINPIVSDTSGIVGGNLNGNETDVNVSGAPSFVRGMAVLEGGNGKMPMSPDGASIGIEVHCGMSGTGLCWQYAAAFTNTFAATRSKAVQSPGWTAWTSNYFTGSGSGLDQLRFVIDGGTGASPFINYIWQHPYGTSGLTTWGPESPLTFGIFTTTASAVTFPLSTPSAAYNKSIAVPNGNAMSDTMVLTAEAQTLTNKSTISGPLAGVVAHGSVKLASGSVPAATCQPAFMVLAAGVASTDTIEWSYGSAPGTADALMAVQPSVGSGRVDFTRCNSTASTQRGTAIAVNWRVVR